MEFAYPLDMTKKEALTRRANMLIEWLRRDKYAVYVDEASVKHLKELIGIIIDVVGAALELSDADERRGFIRLFQDARKILTTEEGEDQEGAYNEAVAYLISSLESYRGYVEDMED